MEEMLYNYLESNSTRIFKQFWENLVQLLEKHQNCTRIKSKIMWKCCMRKELRSFKKNPAILKKKNQQFTGKKI